LHRKAERIRLLVLALPRGALEQRLLLVLLILAKLLVRIGRVIKRTLLVIQPMLLGHMGIYLLALLVLLEINLIHLRVIPENV